MSHNNITRKPASIVLASGQSLPRDHELAAMRAQLDRSDLSLPARVGLIRQYNVALKTWFQNQIDAALVVSEAGTRAATNLKLKDIAQAQKKHTLELRRQYIGMMRNVEASVEEEQVEFVFNAAERLTTWLERIDAARMTPEFKEKTRNMVTEAFDRMIGGLDQLTRDLLQDAEELD